MPRWKLHDCLQAQRPRRRFFIRERGDEDLLEAVAVAAGDDHLVDDHELASVDYVRVAAKGEAIAPPRHDALEASVLVRTPLVDGGDMATGAIATAARSTSAGRNAAGVELRGHARNAFVATATDDVTADARVAHAWHVGPVAASLQVELGAAVLHQSFATAGMAPPRTIGAGLFGAGASLAVPIGHGAAASLATRRS